MKDILQGAPHGKGKRIGVVVSRFNQKVTERLLEGCVGTLLSRGVRKERIDVVSVPGAAEIPSACLWMARKKRYDALVALGAVVRGETPHFEYVALLASRGVSHVSLTENIPIAFGVLTTETVAQAMARSGKGENKGAEAASVALEMAALKRKI